MLHDRRMCDSKAQENTHMSEVGGRKESVKLINDNLKKNSRKGEVIAQLYSMVKIPCAELGYTGLSSGVKGRDK